MPEQPWIVFLRMLWEAYGHQSIRDDDAVAADPSMRNLLPFQKDGVGRARRILEKYNGVLIADEVGLGKTYVGGALVKDTVRARQRVLIVAPKIIRDSVWKPYVDGQHLSGWVDVISYDDLLRKDETGSPSFGLPPGRSPDDFALVLLDEAHTVRNTDTERARQLVQILKGNPRKRVVLLTATPVNNALGDLHSLLSYFIVHDDEFAEIGLPSLAAHFKKIDKLNPDDLSPEHLFDILDAVAVRRTRRFVRNHYIGQKINDQGDTLVFPEPVVRRVDYDLAPVLEGFFDVFAHALGADRDPEEPDPFYAGEIPDGGLSTLDPQRLTLAGYTPSRYRLDKEYKPYEVQVAGLLRSGLLKRFESSGYAFCSTCRKMADTLEGLTTLIRGQSVVASGESLRDWLRIDLDDPASLEEWQSTADYDDASEYLLEPLLTDIESDVSLLRQMADTVQAGLNPEDDPKLQALADTLVKVVAQAERDSTLHAVASLGASQLANQARDRRKVLVFSYFADTINYLQDNINLILDNRPELAVYTDRFAFVTGVTRKTPGHGQEAGTVSQDQAVAGFAPTTGGPQDRHGKPTADDRYDLLFATDVLSEGVNLQQACNIINYDLPWNPMRLVQRHGRVDRIGSRHPFVYLWCFFPDADMDRLLHLEHILHHKLLKAARSIGSGQVLPGIDASDDLVFNARRGQIQALADSDNTLFLGTAGSLISGEEFRAMLRKAIENESLERKLEAMPWGIGSGFIATDRPPGYVFCARILDRADEPAFRYVPLSPALIPRPSTTAEAPAADNSGPEVAGVPLDIPERPAIDGNPVDIVTDTLAALSAASPPDQRSGAHLPVDWEVLAYKAWHLARQDVVRMWNESLDASATTGAVPAAIREAVKHLHNHAGHRNRDDVDHAIRVYQRGQASRVTAIMRAIMHDENLTDQNKTDRMIELIDELGLSLPETKAKRFPIQPEDVHLIAWLALIPQK